MRKRRKGTGGANSCIRTTPSSVKGRRLAPRLLTTPSWKSQGMGKITVFSQDTCPYCKKAKKLLEIKGADFEEISLTIKPEWRQFMYLLTNGMLSLSLPTSLSLALIY